MISEYSSEILIVLVSILIGLVLYVLNRINKKGKYNEEIRRAEIESIRSSLETKMYGINDRLVMNEERWRDVNHLLLRDEYLVNESPLYKRSKINLSEFLRSNGIRENDLMIDQKLIFILTPFHERYEKEYSVIKEVCTTIGFKAYRGDENYIKSDIFPEMLKLIVKANLIIANINGRNPNVLYELGIAQALDKPVILISSEPKDLPIDIKSKRFLIYKSSDELRSLLRKELFNVIEKNE
ncbi:nucleoside 2-deoxyribosyltransferase [Flagellimonas abyssi]|uniref:Nucleoside 2-deoxyribosyltransferase n=1 Tax=Flagellimonas abyssi TaxID=2864871 RepID=A0ABS7EVE8_9FLAO|nr:nucleoside 2-deoxyribosyltransferase [Allomuricauda abyssi]MBW8201597.1 nucleoside 2-deoxyribosyltransferase [Allomuricauda abyssi]